MTQNQQRWRALIDANLPQTSAKARLGGFLGEPAGPEGHSPEAIKAWIVKTTAALNISPTTLAKKAGLAPSTINRFLLGTGSQKNVSASTIDRLTATAVDLVAQAADTKVHTASAALPETSALSVYVAGQASLTPSSSFMGKTATHLIGAIVPTSFRKARLFAIAIADSHAEAAFPKGTIAIACPVDDLGRLPNSAERVCVHIREGELFSTTVREVRVSPNNEIWLVGLSKDHGVRDQFVPDLAELTSGDAPTFISGIIISSYRPEPTFPMADLFKKRD